MSGTCGSGIQNTDVSSFTSCAGPNKLLRRSLQWSYDRFLRDQVYKPHNTKAKPLVAAVITVVENSAQKSGIQTTINNNSKLRIPKGGTLQARLENLR